METLVRFIGRIEAENEKFGDSADSPLALLQPTLHILPSWPLSISSEKKGETSFWNVSPHIGYN